MPDTSLDPRPAHLSGPTKGSGSGPDAWAGSGDHQNTRAEPVPTTIITVPTDWLAMGDDYAELLIKRIDMEAIDFYGGRP